MPEKPPHFPLPLLTTESAEVTQRLLTRLRLALPNEHIDTIDNFSQDQLVAVDVALAANPNEQMLASIPVQLPRLRWVQSLWAGVETLMASAKQHDFKVARLVDPQLAQAMSEAALAWTLYLHRRMPEYLALQRKQQWQQLATSKPSDFCVSILGLGELGRACAARLTENGFKVCGWSTSAKNLPGIRCYQGADGLEATLRQADVLLVLLPLTSDTHNLIDSSALSCLPSRAAVINFARGPIVNTGDLLQALDGNTISHAVLDVFDTEPLPENSPLWAHSRITVLPHIAAPTDPDSAVQIVAQQISRYRENGALPQTVATARGF